jgi:predicted nucleic acid-binding protein
MIKRRAIVPRHWAFPTKETLGLLIYAKQQGLILTARPLVERLRQEGMYLSDQIVNQALAQVGE